jgi:hypothetical protein
VGHRRTKVGRQEAVFAQCNSHRRRPIRIAECAWADFKSGADFAQILFLPRWPYWEAADQEGTILLNDDEARAYAKRIIRELKEAGGYDDPGLTMIVRNACGETLCSIRFIEVG